MKQRYEYRDACEYTVAEVRAGWQELVDAFREAWAPLKHPASIVRWVADATRDLWRAVGKW